jgi:hypothetical protein
MSTTHTPVRQAGRRPGRTVRSVVAAAALTVAALVGVAGTAAPAQAASSFTSCFRFPAPYYGAYGNAAVQVQVWTYGAWHTAWHTQTGFNGCFSFTLTGTARNYPVRAIAQTRVGTALFYGVSPYYAPAGSGSYNLGTGLVWCTGCG